jgi:sugar/nucleoside kinase (ribokinase family)
MDTAPLSGLTFRYNFTMKEITTLQPVDYLIIGHIAVDLTPDGKRLGGTATYSALTAQAMGLRVGIVTSWAAEIPLGLLGSIPVISYPSDQSTIFENIYHDNRRTQKIHHVAERLDFYHIPDAWRKAPIIHLGPIAQEVEPSIVRSLSNPFVGVTPQGWMRAWDEEGHIRHTEWPEARFVLERCNAAVISVEDVDDDEGRIEELAAACSVLVVTEADEGARVYWNGDVRRVRPPDVELIDPTGAGDIFAALFFSRLYQTRDPWEATRFATRLAAISVTRPGFDGIPTLAEINASIVEVF